MTPKERRRNVKGTSKERQRNVKGTSKERPVHDGRFYVWKTLTWWII